MKKSTVISFIIVFICIFSAVNTRWNYQPERANVHPTVKMFENMMHLSDGELFQTFVRVYNKNYDLNSSEGRLRFATFQQNMQEIREHNKASNKGYSLGVTEFADFTSDQLFGSSAEIGQQEVVASTNINSGTKYTPINWVEKGVFGENMYAVQPYSDLKTFISIAASLEFSYYQQNNKTISLSPQALLDCYDFKNNSPLFLTTLYIYLLGLPTYENSVYPYTGITPNTVNCVPPKNGSPFYFTRIQRRLTYDPLDVDSVMYHLNEGPFLFISRITYPTTYTGGIYPGKQEYGDIQPTMLVGYGIDDKGVEYWIVRGSYGKSWGENGYMRLIRNDNSANWGIQRSDWTRPIGGVNQIDNPFNK